MREEKEGRQRESKAIKNDRAESREQKEESREQGEGVICREVGAPEAAPRRSAVGRSLNFCRVTCGRPPRLMILAILVNRRLHWPHVCQCC